MPQRYECYDLTRHLSMLSLYRIYFLNIYLHIDHSGASLDRNARWC